MNLKNVYVEEMNHFFENVDDRGVISINCHALVRTCAFFRLPLQLCNIIQQTGILITKNMSPKMKQTVECSMTYSINIIIFFTF